MGILDNFIKTIKGQRAQYKSEQRQAEMEKIARENEAKAKAAREREWASREKEAKVKAEREREYMGQSKTSDKGYVGEVVDRIKEQRREFEEASKGNKPAPKHAETQTIQELKPEVVNLFSRTFTRIPGKQPHVWFDDVSKSVYIDNVDAYVKSGGKVEQREISAAMDPHMYDIYTNKGGPVGQARYYKPEGMVISLVPDPFKNYR